MGRASISALVVGVVLTSLALGCVEFDEQTVYIEHDEANDRLVVVLHYEGFYAGPDENGDLTEEKLQEAHDQLAEALDKKQMAFFDNWPYVWSIPELTDNIHDGWNLPAPLREEFLWLVAQIRTLNGGFYLDDRGRLCGMQVVVVENLSQVLAKTNAAVGLLSLVAEARNEGGGALLRRFAGGDVQAPFLSVKGHSISLAYPIPEADMMEMRLGFADGVVDGASVEALRQTLGQLVGGPIWAWHEDDLLRVKVGLQSAPSTLVTRPEQGEYEDNLVDHVREAYGFRLFANVLQYVMHPEAPAVTEEEEAAKLIAPRLTREDRVRFLLQQIEAQPTPECYQALHREVLRLGFDRPEHELTDAQLVEFWKERLAGGGQDGE